LTRVAIISAKIIFTFQVAFDNKSGFCSIAGVNGAQVPNQNNNLLGVPFPVSAGMVLHN
jgi:hypothetical protein